MTALQPEITALVARQQEQQRLADGIAAEARHQMNPAEGPIEQAFMQMACDHPEACACTPESIPTFLAALSGGDLPADAVREERCLRQPIGCGQPLITEDGTTRVFWNEAEAAAYQSEWRITGLCPDCQDRLTDEDGAL